VSKREIGTRKIQEIEVLANFSFACVATGERRARESCRLRVETHIKTNETKSEHRASSKCVFTHRIVLHTQCKNRSISGSKPGSGLFLVRVLRLTFVLSPSLSLSLNLNPPYAHEAKRVRASTYIVQ